MASLTLACLGSSYPLTDFFFASISPILIDSITFCNFACVCVHVFQYLRNLLVRIYDLRLTIWLFPHHVCIRKAQRAYMEMRTGGVGGPRQNEKPNGARKRTSKKELHKDVNTKRAATSLSKRMTSAISPCHTHVNSTV